MGQEEKHVRFNDTPEVKTYKKNPAEHNAEVIVNPVPAPEKHVTFADAPEVRTYDPAEPPSPAAPAPGSPPAPASMAPPATPPGHSVGAPPPPSLGAPPPPASPGAPPPPASPGAPGKRDDGPKMEDMPRDPVKLAAWLKENEGKLPADERAMLDKAIAGGKEIRAQGPPIEVDMGDQGKSKSMLSGLGDRISKFATEMKDKIKNTFGRDDAAAAPQQAQSPVAPGRSPAQMGAPSDPAKYAEWLQNNQQLLSPKEKELMNQVAAQNKAPANAPSDPGQYAQWLQKNPQALSPKEKDLANHIAGQSNAPSMADAPRDPAQYAQWLQKNPQLLSPPEQALAAHAQGSNEPGAHAAPAANEPGSHAPSVPAASPNEPKAQEPNAPEPAHTAHPLYTPAQAHEVAKEIALEHQQGHAIERGGH